MNGLEATLLVQPQYARRNKWERLAEQENLAFEVLELSMPPALHNGIALREQLSWYKIVGRCVSLHGAFMDINVASNDPEIRAVSQARCRESCILAVGLGASQVVFHSSAYPYLDDDHVLDNWAMMCTEVYLPMAEEFQLTICIENCLDQTPKGLRKLMEYSHSPKVRVCLDLGHVNYSPTPLEEWIAELGPYVDSLHLSDNRGQMDEHLPLGEGTVDWAKASGLCAGFDWPIPITLETGGLEGAAHSLGYLRRHGYFGLGVSST